MSYKSRAENENFLVGALLGFHPTTNAVRLIQTRDKFAGSVRYQHAYRIMNNSMMNEKWHSV
jgi:hypothetical protein